MSWTTLLNAVLLGVELVTAVPNPQQAPPTLTFSTAVASPSSPASSLLPSQAALPPTQPWCPSEIFCAGSVSTSCIHMTSCTKSSTLGAYSRSDHPNSSSKLSTSQNCTRTRRLSSTSQQTNSLATSSRISPPSMEPTPLTAKSNNSSIRTFPAKVSSWKLLLSPILMPIPPSSMASKTLSSRHGPASSTGTGHNSSGIPTILLYAMEFLVRAPSSP